MGGAGIAVLLISADFLTSGFIRGTEVPRLLERRAEEGLRIIPLILWPCPWQRVAWLAGIQARPKDGRPLADGSAVQIEKDLSSLAGEIADLLGHDAHASRPATISPTAEESPKGRALTLWKEKLAFFQEQEAIAADSSQKFALRKQIEEAKERIRELEG